MFETSAYCSSELAAAATCATAMAPETAAVSCRLLTEGVILAIGLVAVHIAVLERDSLIQRGPQRVQERPLAVARGGVPDLEERWWRHQPLSISTHAICTSAVHNHYKCTGGTTGCRNPDALCSGKFLLACIHPYCCTHDNVRVPSLMVIGHCCMHGTSEGVEAMDKYEVMQDLEKDVGAPATPPAAHCRRSLRWP